jgi:hypothetical protein
MTLKKSIRGSQFKRFCSTCNKEHTAMEWYPLFTYGVKKPTSWNCPRYLDPNYVCKRGPKSKPEFIPESMREDRKENAKSMIQPWREGEVSAEFIQAYPKQANKMFTQEERMKAKEVWKGELPSYWEKTR